MLSALPLLALFHEIRGGGLGRPLIAASLIKWNPQVYLLFHNNSYDHPSPLSRLLAVSSVRHSLDHLASWNISWISSGGNQKRRSRISLTKSVYCWSTTHGSLVSIWSSTSEQVFLLIARSVLLETNYSCAILVKMFNSPVFRWIDTRWPAFMRFRPRVTYPRRITLSNWQPPVC